MQFDKFCCSQVQMRVCFFFLRLDRVTINMWIICCSRRLRLPRAVGTQPPDPVHAPTTFSVPGERSVSLYVFRRYAFSLESSRVVIVIIYFGYISVLWRLSDRRGHAIRPLEPTRIHLFRLRIWLLLLLLLYFFIFFSRDLFQ